MAIPEAQLETWSHQGSVKQSRDTYATVKRVLHHSDAPYSSLSFDSFLQGSYGNDTNVYRDSDVDIVMRLDSLWYHNASSLHADQYAAYGRAYPGSVSYVISDFKIDVTDWLKRQFGNTVNAGSKAIFIPGNGSRRDCDVLPCARFKHYYSFISEANHSYDEGICFFLADGTRIINFPKQHAENCTLKHKSTNKWFKPTVRIYKNMRNHMIGNGVIGKGVAPSYFIEGLLWNVPPVHYGASYEDTFVNTFNFINGTNREEFTCANGIHYLLRDIPHTCWAPANCETYLNALGDLWKNWR